MAPRTVFLSSTRKDLRPYIDAVDAALQGLSDPELKPDRNEYWGAVRGSPSLASRRKVLGAQLFVGIYGWRYGTVPRGAKTSITEQELEMAFEAEKPIFCYLVEDSAPRPADLEEEPEESLRLLAKLKDRVREDFAVERFTHPEDLAQRVVRDLCNDAALEALLTKQQGSLRGLWKTVHHYWIRRLLRPISAGSRIQIKREERPELVDLVASPRDREAEADSPIDDLFQGARGKLLLVGGRAAGKTTELLDLADGRGKLAWGCPDAKIPVVFHLGSWHERQSLETWMADHLHEHLDAGEDDAKAWIEGNHILPLLDSLDAVAADCREQCVAAIDTYLKARGQKTGLVVCCESEVYGRLPHLGRLKGAAALLPLTPEQVDAHLAARGAELAGLRAAITGSAELQRLAASPLLLGRLEEIYRGRPAKEVDVRSEEELAETWVQHALKPRIPWEATEPPRRTLPWRRPTGKAASLPRLPYAQATARRALAWLARNMAAHYRPLLKVEHLQASWLEERWQVWAYALVSRAAGGVLVALPLAWLFRETGLAGDLVAFGAIGGALAGAVDATVLQPRSPQGALRTRRRRYVGATMRGLLVFSVVGLTIPLLGPLWLRLSPSGLDAGTDADNLRLAAALLAPLLGAVFGSRAAIRGRNRDVRFHSAFAWRGWSWRGVSLGAVWGGMAGAAVGVSGWLNPTLDHLPSVLWLLIPLLFGAIGALAGGALGGVRPLERKLQPNKGTWLALRNAGVVALCVGIASTLVSALYLLVFPTSSTAELSRYLLIAASAGLALGWWAGLGFSGLDFVQHFALRGVLALSGPVPARLVKFLDFASDRKLLEKTGGSYKFRDAFVRRYFEASRDKEEIVRRRGRANHGAARVRLRSGRNRSPA
jgi:Domain of unknown function (DUF4062)